VGSYVPLLLIRREESRGITFSRLKLALAPAAELDLASLGWIIDCPPEEIEFSRVGPIELAHGSSWAQRHHLDSYRWPLLDQPVIHGQAVGIRIGVPFPKGAGGHGADCRPLRTDGGVVGEGGKGGGGQEEGGESAQVLEI
jgi:hypothetical protein